MKNINHFAPANRLKIKTIDMHTGGEPLRVIVDGLPEIKGETILQKRRYFQKHFDHIRTGLMFEPRGHADMYGAVVTNPTSLDGDFGVFFMHNEGYSTMCGHAAIAITKLAIESGLIEYDGKQPVKIDAPAGRLLASAKMKNGKATECSFKNVPSFVFLEDEAINVPGIGIIKFDIAFGGAFYAICDAKTIGLKLNRSGYNKIIDYGRRIKSAIQKKFEIKHPFEPDLSFLYGVIFTGKALKKNHHSRNVCVFANGEVDRSPTGSGVSARAALQYKKGKLGIGEEIIIESILGTTMRVEISESVNFELYDAVIPEVTGTAYFTGQHQFWFDPDDPLKKGFIFR